MATLCPPEKKNHLELYLNDVYEKECVFKIEKEEVDFIQTGIETLVQDLVDKILADDSTHKIISDQIDKSPILMEEIYHEKYIAEIYFSIQSDCSLKRYVAENASYVKTINSTIIKVGSFYDGTKNNFPDEFDFIFPILGVRTSVYFSDQDSSDFYKTICRHAKHIYATSPSEKHEVTRELEFDKYLDKHGPAYKIRFIYSNEFREQRYIHVDLVPAYKIIDSNALEEFVKEVRENVVPKTFREEILAAGSSLNVGDNLAFTEIEQHFMKKILSKKHLKVYRILKYLLNGHGEGETLEELLRGEPYYTSYRIKILIIYHHETCKNTDTENLGLCVLQVLEEMSKYKNVYDFPKFISNFFVYPVNKFELLPYLNSTIETLRSMQTSEDSYCYEREKIKSVSGQYLVFLTRDQNQDTKTRQCCVLL